MFFETPGSVSTVSTSAAAFNGPQGSCSGMFITWLFNFCCCESILHPHPTRHRRPSIPTSRALPHRPIVSIMMKSTVDPLPNEYHTL